MISTGGRWHWNCFEWFGGIGYVRIAKAIYFLVFLIWPLFFAACQVNPFESMETVPHPNGSTTKNYTPETKSDPWFVRFVEWKVKVLPPVNGCVRVYGEEGAVRNAIDGDVVHIVNHSRTELPFVEYVVEKNGSFNLSAADTQCLPGAVGDQLTLEIYRQSRGSGISIRKRVNYYAQSPKVQALLLAADPNYVWLGATCGVYYCRADVERLEECSHWTALSGLSNDDVRKLIMARDGAVWAGTNDGVTRIRLREDRPPEFTAYGTEDGIKGGHVYDLIEGKKDGAIWMATDDGLSRLTIREDGTPKVENHTVPQSMSTKGGVQVLETDDGVWGLVGSLSVGAAVCYADGKSEFLECPPGLLVNARQIYVTSDGSLWIASRDSGLIRRENGGKITSHLKATTGLPNNNVTAVLETRQGAFWVLTVTGLAQGRINDTGLVALTSVIPSGGWTVAFPASWATGFLFEAEDGTIWIRSEYYGIAGLSARPDGGSFSLMPYQTGSDLSDNFIYSGVRVADDLFWIATRSGVVRWMNGVVKKVGVQSGLPGQGINSLIEGGDGSVWVGAIRSLVRFNDGTFSGYIPAYSDAVSDNISNVIQAPDGSMWVNRSYCVSHVWVNREGVPDSREYARAVSGDWYRKMAVSMDGSVWLGTYYGDLIHLTILPDGSEDTEIYGNAQLLGKGPIGVLVERKADHSVWFGNGNGIGRLKDGVFTSYKDETGLALAWSKQMVEGRDGSMWVSNEAGLYHVMFAEDVPVEPPVHYTKANTVGMGDGLIGDDVKVITVAKNGSLWIGTSDGLNHLKFDENRRPVFTSYSKETTGGLRDNTIRRLFETEDGSMLINTGGAADLSRFDSTRNTLYVMNAGLPGTNIAAFLQTQNGAIWIGTDTGIAVLFPEDFAP